MKIEFVYFDYFYFNNIYFCSNIIVDLLKAILAKHE